MSNYDDEVGQVFFMISPKMQEPLHSLVGIFWIDCQDFWNILGE